MVSLYKPSFDLDAARSFIAVVDLDGFTAAADALAKTQSTVSHQIRRLEEQLGRALLTRTTRKIALTLAGETFLADARALLEMAEKAESRLLASQLAGEVRLGVPEELACALLPEVLVAFRRQQPNIRVAVSVGVSGNLKRAVENGELDLAVIKRSPAVEKALVAQPLCWAGHPALMAADPLPVAFFPDPCEFRSRALEALQRAGRAFDIVMTTTSYQSLYAVSRRKLAVTVLALSDCPEDLRLESDPSCEAALPALPTMSYTLENGGNAGAPTIHLKKVLSREMARSLRRR